MKADAILFYTLLLYSVCCSIMFGVGIFNIDIYLTCIFLGCCLFLMYYVLRFFGKLLVKFANCLLDILCKLIEWIAPIVKDVYYIIMGFIMCHSRTGNACIIHISYRVALWRLFGSYKLGSCSF